jgi:hypothetical protein
MAHETQRFGINDFLTLTEGKPAQSMLLSAFNEMFCDATQSHG